MKRNVLIVFALLVIGCIGAWIWNWDGNPPVIEAPDFAVVGPTRALEIGVRDEGRGLRRISIVLEQGPRQAVLAAEEMSLSWLPWRNGPAERSFALEEWKTFEVAEGPFQLSIHAEDQPNFWLISRSSEVVLNCRYDATPPRIAPVPADWRVQQGGSELVVYEVSEPEDRSGVLVGDRSFEGVKYRPLGENVRLCLFALGHNQPLDARVSLWAEDAAGNRSKQDLPCRLLPGRFRTREITLTDAFMQKVVPGILEQVSERGPDGELLDRYLWINRELRRRNNEEIRTLTSALTPERYWSQPFLQLRNTQVEAVFADHRKYFYQGRLVDEQVHLGFDLASVAHSPVEAANTGRVVFAGALGIYGNTVIVDHGWGLYSLYAHLSRIDVESGRLVQRGEPLGNTGQTGLAGGDHLHFSMLVQGEQVSPLEWWDPNWIRNHVEARLGGL
jgi:murein DD-endopeptidase MepM/ murein hydrolase activator NlpD